MRKSYFWHDANLFVKEALWLTGGLILFFIILVWIISSTW